MANFNNDADGESFTRGCSQEVSKQNFELVERVAKDYMTDGVVEIGVARNQLGSFTYAMLNNKPDTVPYLGIDINDKSFLNDIDKNINTIQSDSFDQETVRNYMKEIGMEKISVLFIDGWHSVNAVINDWKYSDMLSENGIVIFHDTNYHPGPAVFLEYIDKELFRVEKHFEGQNDYGVGIAYRIKK
jgi:23S rRNA U2552 (ribose-2'-O)-methylase RlmE/FtsJ